MNDDQYEKLISWLATINNKIETTGSLYDDLSRRLSHINSILREIEWFLIAITIVVTAIGIKFFFFSGG